MGVIQKLKRRNVFRVALAYRAVAWLGDREAVNRLAARIDQHPFWHHVLTPASMWCACGAPFDLEVTPNYAAKLEEAGFHWPPPAPINFPWKDW